MAISEDDFMEQFLPIEVDSEGDFMLDTYERALNLAEEKKLSESSVWTVVETGEGDNALFVEAGFHKVNALGFVVTSRPWVTGMEQAVWAEPEDYDLSHGPM